jgi:hypothetical protein
MLYIYIITIKHLYMETNIINIELITPNFILLGILTANALINNSN